MYTGARGTGTYGEHPPCPPVVDVYGLLVLVCKAEVRRGHKAGFAYIYLDRRVLSDWDTDRGAGHIRVWFESREREDVDIPTAC